MYFCVDLLECRMGNCGNCYVYVVITPLLVHLKLFSTDILSYNSLRNKNPFGSLFKGISVLLDKCCQFHKTCCPAAQLKNV